MQQKRAILYARVSGDDRQNVTSSISAQLDECRKYAAQRGYQVVDEVFEDPDKHTSGADWLPELDRVIRLAPNGTFDVLICHKVDRLARERYKHLGIKIELNSHNVAVEYAALQFDDSEEGRLLEGLVSEFAQYERAVITRRIQSGKLRSVASGNIMIGGSVAPYGYDMMVVNNKRTLVLNDGEAETVRLIFELYAIKLYSLYEVGKYLDDHKIPLPSKGNNHRLRSKRDNWSVGTISGLLDQETYIGTWYYRKTKQVKNPKTGKTQSKPRPKEEWFAVSVPAIVSQELFDVVQDRRKRNKLEKGRQRRYEYALGGMLQCGHCRNNMSGMTKTHKGVEYRYYKCHAHHLPKRYGFKCDNAQFAADRVEALVWSWIKSLLLEPETLRRVISEYQQEQRERIRPQLSMLESTQARLEELEGQKTRLIDAYSRGILSLDELASNKSTLDKEIGELTQAIGLLRAETEPQVLSAARIETIEGIAAEIRDGAILTDGNKETQRAIFQLLDVHVDLSFDGHQRWADIRCNFGSERYAVEYTSNYAKQHGCIITTRLPL